MELSVYPTIESMSPVPKSAPKLFLPPKRVNNAPPPPD